MLHGDGILSPYKLNIAALGNQVHRFISTVLHGSLTMKRGLIRYGGQRQRMTRELAARLNSFKLHC